MSSPDRRSVQWVFAEGLAHVLAEHADRAGMTSTDSPDLAAAKRLLDRAKLGGFEFVRTASGPDGPLLGRRITGRWLDTVYLEGLSRDCHAWRQRRSPLLTPGQKAERQISGSALDILNDVLTWDTT